MPQALLCVLLAPSALMLAGGALVTVPAVNDAKPWQSFLGLSAAATLCALLNVVAIWLTADSSPAPHAQCLQPWLAATPLGTCIALLVQVIGGAIGAFSSRYLAGEPGQCRYISSLAWVLGSVQLLLIADHWLVMIGCWALVGVMLQRLLCFYADRPFAQLAALKKRAVDRLADVLLVLAATLSWSQVGSGSLTELMHYVESHGDSWAIQASTICLILAIVLRTALIPAHGWLIQVMEAPTPVSALLHAGVVNLGGFWLIRFAPLISNNFWAQSLLVALGLGSAVLAGLVMLTRVSIKVSLAWSTVAQMGFMILECGLGLYSLAALHLFGHSLYKAHRFLAASSVVQDVRQARMAGSANLQPYSLVLAPIVAVAVVVLTLAECHPGAWPWWWSSMLGFAWASFLWMPMQSAFDAWHCAKLLAVGIVTIAGLTGAALLGHLLPLDIQDHPNAGLGMVALFGMALLYLSQATLLSAPTVVEGWRRWSYAGYYVDERFTRLVLLWWPNRWMPKVRVRPYVALGPTQEQS